MKLAKNIKRRIFMQKLCLFNVIFYQVIMFLLMFLSIFWKYLTFFEFQQWKYEINLLGLLKDKVRFKT